MKQTLRRIALGTLLVLPMGLALPALASPVVPIQDHHDDDRDHNNNAYANSTYYRTGNREGYQDHQKNERRKEHHHKYRNDDDRKAHDAGYEEGWQGHRYNDPH